MVGLKNGSPENQITAKKLLRFMTSAEAQTILKESRYTLSAKKFEFNTMNSLLLRSLLTFTLLTSAVYALTTQDRILKPNAIVEYTKVPGEVDSLTKMLTQGEIYGRLRSNNFWYNYEQSDVLDSDTFGVGGGIIYKSGYYHGVGATTGFYGSTTIGSDNTLCTETTCSNTTQAGKDLFRAGENGKEEAIGVFAVAYGEWKNHKTSLKAGRQMVETVLLSSNDAKMIPNTFEGFSIENSSVNDTSLKLGYLTQQKLRNHQNFHSVIAFQVKEENDDGASHKGLSVSKLQEANKDVNPEIIFATLTNQSLENLKLYGEYVGIQGYFHTLIAEANYAIILSDSWKLTPGIRYLQQFDDGAGAVGGAALSGLASTTTAYNDPNNLDTSLINARVVLSNSIGSIAIGYSDVADKADVIAPWRGFPTGGYTRAMAQTNWYANTQSWMINGMVDFNKAQIIPGLICSASYSYINIDDEKSNKLSIVSSDRNVVYADAIQTFSALPNTEFKFRFATVDSDTVLQLPNKSYTEYRFEINYLF
ncbi:MAG: outer membrane porin, OprD family [Epsilonproteobacteria bacterium]|nr:outer membrane porin, OprD family [Campylobacterota bacterium]